MSDQAENDVERRGRRVVELFQICIADPDNHMAAWEADEALRELELVLQSSEAAVSG